MRTSLLMVCAALMLAQDMAGAQDPWGSVKSWTGSVTVDATDTHKGEAFSSTMTYKATGNFTISDDMLPDGAHGQWPMPSVETMTDPKQLATAYERWQARVVASYEARGVNEMGEPFTVTCAADHEQPSAFGVAIHPNAPTYVVSVSPPQARFKCTGPEGTPRPNGQLRQPAFQLTGQRGAPGPVSGTQTFTVDTSTIKISYKMAPTQ